MKTITSVAVLAGVVWCFVIGAMTPDTSYDGPSFTVQDISPAPTYPGGNTRLGIDGR